MTAGALSTQGELRRFGLVMATVVALLFGLALPMLFDRPHPLWPWILAALFLGAAVVWPRGLGPVYRTWMAFGGLMARVNGVFILGLAYVLLVIPIGLAMRLWRVDPLHLRPPPSGSLLKKSTPRPPSHMERPF